MCCVLVIRPSFFFGFGGQGPHTHGTCMSAFDQFSHVCHSLVTLVCIYRFRCGQGDREWHTRSSFFGFGGQGPDTELARQKSFGFGFGGQGPQAALNLLVAHDALVPRAPSNMSFPLPFRLEAWHHCLSSGAFAPSCLLSFRGPFFAMGKGARAAKRAVDDVANMKVALQVILNREPTDAEVATALEAQAKAKVKASAQAPPPAKAASSTAGRYGRARQDRNGDSNRCLAEWWQRCGGNGGDGGGNCLL